MEPPFFSVITPVYNRTCVENAANSILTQKYQNWEHIIIDDGSTDETPLVLKKLSQRDSRIRVLTQENNKGVSAARNWGFKAAQGEYILCLDSDDIFVEGAFEYLFDTIKHTPDIDVIVFNISRYVDKEQTTSNVFVDRLFCKKEIKKEILGSFIHASNKIKGINYRPIVCNKCTRRRMIINNGIFFDETKRTWEDWEVCMKIFQYAQWLQMSNKVIIKDRFTQEDDHLSMAYYSDGAKNTLETYKMIVNTFGEDFNLSSDYTVNCYYSDLKIWIQRTMAKDKNRRRILLDIFKDDSFRFLVSRHVPEGKFEKIFKMAIIHHFYLLAFYICVLQNRINNGRCW